jgi:hypothetical protein
MSCYLVLQCGYGLDNTFDNVKSQINIVICVEHVSAINGTFGSFFLSRLCILFFFEIKSFYILFVPKFKKSSFP